MNLNKEQQKYHIELLQKHYFFDIELSSICNINCEFCLKEYITRKNRVMQAGILDLLSEWLPNKASIMFSGMGEPLLNKKIFNLIKRLKQVSNNRIVGITTNGQLLTEQIIKKILDSRLDFLQISLNTTNANKYKSLSGGFDILPVLKGVEIIKKKNINKQMQLQFSFVSDIEKEKNIKQQQIFAEKYDASFFQKQIHNRGGYLYSKPKHTYNPCYIFSQVTYINSDGNILYCCHDLKAEIIIGNIKHNSFKEVIKIKKQIIKDNNWLMQCEICDDSGRSQLIK